MTPTADAGAQDKAPHYNLPTDYQTFVHLSRYSRYKWDEGRRETWPETVERYMSFMKEHLKERCNYDVPPDLFKEITDAIIRLDIMPSMRGLMTAGPALKRDEVSIYNCTATAINRTTAFDEIMYVLMNGCGAGFSVERQYVSQLPSIADDFHNTDITIVVQDSKIGWCKALRELIALLYSGQIPSIDVSKVRPAGAPLKTFGGRASGPEPLEDLFRFAIDLFKKAAGRKLNSAECHDLVCKIADVIVVGGVRRSALISLSNLSDDRMRAAKSGQWWEAYPHRRLANNSAAYTEKPEVGQFMDEWKALYESKSGERGIFNRQGAKKKIAAQKDVARNPNYDFGVNPCAEILLRIATELGQNAGGGLCNLSSVTIRPDDTMASLMLKVMYASILGTWQSTLTEFRYLSKKWQHNAEEERLLGVSLNGIMDNRLTNGSDKNLADNLETLKAVAVRTNKEYAKILGIPESVAITCVKPEGTTSQFVNCGSGMHPWHSKYYIRRVRQDIKDPLTRFMIEAGFPGEPDIMKPDQTWVFEFPIRAPKTAKFNDDFTAIQHMDLWKIYHDHWCHHNPSITVSVREHEWIGVGAWVWENFDSVTGMSFLPHSDHTYRQAPYEAVDEKGIKALEAKMPKDVDWSKLTQFETTDMTAGAQTLACAAGGCEL